MLRAITACTFSTTNGHRIVKKRPAHRPGVLSLFTSKCASRHNGVHFFDIAIVQKWSEHSGVLYIFTSKCASRHNGVHFFQHLNFQKSSESVGVLCTFDFKMCFAPQRRALFRTSQLPKVVRPCRVLYIFTSKCASRHNGVHFFNISTSKSGLRPTCFATFDSQNVLLHFFHISTSKSAPRHDVF